MGDSFLDRARRLATPRALIAALVVAYVAVRLLFLRADPPFAMFHGWHLRELLVEPVAKASEARNFGIFGSFKPNPADNYGFWRPQSPVWVDSLGLFFRVFGAGYAPLRIYATLVCAAGLWALLALTSRRLGVLAAALTGFFLVFDHVGILYERSGLIEPVVAALILVAYDALDRAREKVTWLLVAEVVALAAFFAKQAAVVAFVPLLVCSILALVDARGVARPRVARAAVLGAAAVLLGVLAYGVTRPEYQRVLTWDYGNVMLGRGGFQPIALDDLDKGSVFANLDILKERAGVAARIFLFTGPLALIEIGRVFYGLARRRPVDRARLLFALHAVCTAAIIIATKPTNVRFLLLLSAPFAFLSASLLSSLWARLAAGPRPALRRLVLVVPAAFLAFHAYQWGLFAVHRTYHVTEAAARVTASVGDRPDAVIIGFWSAPIVFDTRYQHYYVKPGFNDTRSRLDALKPTHFIFFTKDGDPSKEIVKRRDRPLFEGATRLWTSSIHHRGIAFYKAPEAPAPLPEPPAADTTPVDPADPDADDPASP